MIPVVVLLDNIRSMYNVGSFFRTADAAGVERLLLGGITGKPPKSAIAKTALGAEQRVPWQHKWSAVDFIGPLVEEGYEIAAVETHPRAVDLFEWTPKFPVCLMFGHEVDGLQPELIRAAATLVRIPMLGSKRSLNVATAGGVAVYELLRKYRSIAPAAEAERRDG